MTTIAVTPMGPKSGSKSDPALKLRASLLLSEFARTPKEQVLRQLETTDTGLTESEAERRLEKFGANQVSHEQHQNWAWRLLRTVRNPLVILLAVLVIVESVSGDISAASVMAAMVVIGVLLRFVQETRADSAAAALRKMIHVTTAALRDGRANEIPLERIVPGDVVQLSAGDMIPADVCLLAAKDLVLIESSLTGESFPVEKTDGVDQHNSQSGLDLANICLLGTSVERGSGTAVDVATGAQTYFGQMARHLTANQPPTSFDRGVSAFTWLMISFMAIMVPVVFIINFVTKHDWKQALFFSLAVAVGLTPEMLPTIISVCLSKVAMAMGRKKVIVKRLNSIQNLGAMDVLCTDKTGTLTLDHCHFGRRRETAARPRT